MTDLTEKLKAGELYYVKKKNGKIVIRQAHLYSCLRTENSMPFVDFEDNDIEEVMAAVPSYNEVQALKELLKECYKMLAQYHVENSEPSLDENIELLTEIDNAIGEKK